MSSFSASIKSIVALMEAEKEDIKVRSSYNIAAISFSPKEVAEAIKSEMQNFNISYRPDSRQDIADSWPDSIDDSHARNDWGWQHQYDLQKMTHTILEGLASLLNQ